MAALKASSIMKKKGKSDGAGKGKKNSLLDWIGKRRSMSKKGTKGGGKAVTANTTREDDEDEEC